MGILGNQTRRRLNPGRNKIMDKLRFFPLALTLFLTTLLLSNLPAQTEDTARDSVRTTVQLELVGGSVLVGYVITENDSILVLELPGSQQVTVKKANILRRQIIEGKVRNGQVWQDDPNQTRLLFAPTGRALKQGEGYFAVYEVFLPFVAVGVTDQFTLAGGVSLVPGASSQLVYLAPKFTPYQDEKMAFSTGVLYLQVPDETDGGGVLYGVSTFGSFDRAFTVGAGWGFGGGEFVEKPVIILGGEARVGRYTKVISENYLVPGEKNALVSGGVRFFGENLAADFSLLALVGEDTSGFPFVPWIGFAYNFGKK